MKPPILLIEVIEIARKYDDEIYIAKDCDCFSMLMCSGEIIQETIGC